MYYPGIGSLEQRDDRQQQCRGKDREQELQDVVSGCNEQHAVPRGGQAAAVVDEREQHARLQPFSSWNS